MTIGKILKKGISKLDVLLSLKMEKKLRTDRFSHLFSE